MHGCPLLRGNKCMVVLFSEVINAWDILGVLFTKVINASGCPLHRGNKCMVVLFSEVINAWLSSSQR